MASDTPLNWLDDDQLTPGMQRARYVIAGEEDGTWSVYDTKTDLPAILEEQMLVKLTFEQADDMVELLNQIEADAKRQKR